MLDSRLRGNDGFQDCAVIGNDGFQDYGVVGMQLNRHSHESGNLERGVWATVFIR
ncbi:Uncharacterised protein [Neisseria meningitidis]|nr:Uncharacterised protein [Neisseria meningitidis]